MYNKKPIRINIKETSDFMETAGILHGLVKQKEDINATIRKEEKIAKESFAEKGRVNNSEDLEKLA
jgi:hypothetical protein